MTLNEYILTGLLLFFDIFILFSYLIYGRKSKPYTKYGVFSFVFLLSSLGVYLPLDKLHVISIPYFYVGITVIFIPWFIISIIINYKNDYDVRERLRDSLYGFLGFLVFFVLVIILAITVIDPVQSKYGVNKALSCFLLFSAIWLSIRVFASEKYSRLKEASFSILFILMSVLYFLDYINKWSIGGVVGITLVIYFLGRWIEKKHDNDIYIGRY